MHSTQITQGFQLGVGWQSSRVGGPTKQPMVTVHLNILLTSPMVTAHAQLLDDRTVKAITTKIYVYSGNLLTQICFEFQI